MFYNHLFWIALAILFCSAMNIYVYFEFDGTNKTLRKSTGALGVLGLIVGHINLVMLSLQFNWWWFFGGIGTFLLSAGILSFLFRYKVRNIFGILNFLIIPFFWWYGSKFNTLLSFDWFYDLVESSRNFFA